ncbi:2-dehydro-3-deoxygluconokinase [Zophobihabitans entericus]|uniref:2-dehydro-3-deoxygluconokinase n=1 Tax=Zophobihabitans entericus TaxID=1635327 RepID=A0A6G9ID69_9GAMM|nr:sugar kinase [Zophobihabitans entericus]QIQ21759.1 sugar kinase [Zophobihabitans entericus]
MTTNIAVIGECMIELSEKHKQAKRSFGGDTLNTSVYMARLLPHQDYKIHYVTGLGTDSFSDEMITAWQKEGVATDLVQRMANKLPGLYAIVTDDKGERSFYYWRNDAAARFWLKTAETEIILKQIENYQYLYLSGISIAILDGESLRKLVELLKRFRAKGGKVAFDNNYRPRLWADQQQAQAVYWDILSCTDIAFLTLDDEDLLWGKQSLESVIKRSKQLGISEIIIKRGAESCIIDAPEGQFDVPANKIAKSAIVDTTAAGDSFSAGYLAARLQGKDPVSAAKQGHLVAGTVIQHQGAVIPKEAMPKIK